MTEFPKNPFEPGFGLDPAYRGPRPEVESVLSGLVNRLRDGDRGSRAAFLYGPRGNGKTVLLHWLHAEAEKDGEPGEKIVVARLSPGDMASPAVTARSILRMTSRFGHWTGRVKETVVRIPLLGSLRLAGVGPSPSPEEVLSRKRSPLLLTLDEAHEVTPERLGRLLNAVQRAGEVRPIAAVFAGTPGLEAKLLETRASFWSRGEQLPVGLLAKESARDALARPFRDAGLGTADEAVAKLAAAADNYPYFLQLYGRAAWDAVKESGGEALLPEHVASALKAANGQRQVYYRHRLDEFFKAEFLPLARDVAEAFVKSASTPADRRLSDAEFREILAGQGDAVKAREFLTAKGYVWREATDSSSWTPGIPSMMDYMLEEIPVP